MSRNLELPQSDQAFQDAVIDQLAQLVTAVTEGFVYIILVMAVFSLLRQSFHYKMDKTSSNILDEKLDKTIKVLDEKLTQY